MKRAARFLYALLWVAPWTLVAAVGVALMFLSYIAMERKMP